MEKYIAGKNVMTNFGSITLQNLSVDKFVWVFHVGNLFIRLACNPLEKLFYLTFSGHTWLTNRSRQLLALFLLPSLMVKQGVQR